MNGNGGQAGRVIGAVLRFLAKAALTLFALAALGGGVLAWRLDQGPLQIPYIASALATAVSNQGITVHIDQAALAWAGYKKGGGAPLYLQLTGIAARNAGGVTLAAAPHARLVFPMLALFGLPAPLEVEGDGARLMDADATVAGKATFRFGFGFALRRADMSITLGPGTIGPPNERLAVSGGSFALSLTATDAVLRNGRLDLKPVGQSAPVIGFGGTAHRGRDWRAALTVTADKVRVADLPSYWPGSVGVGARRWVVANLHGGVADNVNFLFTLAAPGNLSDVTLDDVRGGYDASGLTLDWLPGVTPITALDGHLQVTDPDTLVITARRGALGRLAVRAGSMKITGLSQNDQTGDVKIVLEGQLADAVALLNGKPLNLLAQAPAPLLKATGALHTEIAATVPLEAHLKLPRVKLAVETRMTGVTLPTPIEGLGFTDGALLLSNSATALNVTGTARLGGEPATFAAAETFAATPPLRHFELKTALGPAALHGLGLDAATTATDAVGGRVPVTLRADAAPGGDQATLDADLTAARLGVPVFGWSKKGGQPGALHVAAVLPADGPVRVESMTATGPALDIKGTLRGGDLHLDPLRIGRTEATGDVKFPAGGRGWLVALSGPSLDVRAILNPPSNPKAAARAAPPAPGAEKPSGPPWQARLRFTTLWLAAPPAPALGNLVFSGAGSGDTVQTVAATAAQAGKPMSLRIGPAAAGRRGLNLAAADGGGLLRSLGAYDDVQGGTLALIAQYGAGGPFAGTVELKNFQLLKAPRAAKVLQALTLYGAPEAAAGPGLVFSRLIAPFSIAHQVLTLDDARAYSASLGFTASGTIDVDDGTTDLDATIIPAYALNALPGKIPVIGKLFTAEKGGGLFALRVKVGGTLAAPKLSANPLSALTPGALRGVFNGRRTKP